MIGKTVNRYEVIAKLGEGGMGAVWKARDPLLGRDIALKFLPDALASSPEARERFLREARAASALSHPGIATVFDVGEVGDRVYIAMALVEGETIRDRARRAPFSIDEAVRIGARAARVLGHAHGRGIFHRDVKSANIMETDDGDVVVVDFGLARATDVTTLTASGTAMGTAPYMAPEVIVGHRADHRADIYGLGVVLHEMLTGELPFTGEHREALFYRILNEDAPAPSASRDEIPPELDAIVLKTLAKEPGDRYADAESLASDLEAFDRGDTSSLAALERPGGLARLARPWRRAARPAGAPRDSQRHRWLRPLIAALVALILVAAATRLFVDRGGYGTTFGSVAVLPPEIAENSTADAEWLSDGVGEMLATRLTQVGLRVSPWITSRRFKDTALPLPNVAKSLNVEALVVGRLRTTAERIRGTVSVVDGTSGHQIWIREFDVAREGIFDFHREIAVGAASILRGRISETEKATLAKPASQSVKAYEYYLQGALALKAGTRKDDNRALALFEKAMEIDPSLAEAHVGVGAVYANRFFFGWEGGIQSLRLAEQSFERALEAKPNMIAAVNGLIRVHYEFYDPAKLLTRLESLDVYGPDHVESVSVRGQGYTLLEWTDKAVPLLRHAIELDPLNEVCHWFLVFALCWGRQFDEALDAGDTYIRTFGADPETLTWIAFAHHALGEYDEAELYYDRAIALFGDQSNEYVHIYAGLLQEDHLDPERAKEIWRDGLESVSRKLQLSPDNFRMRDISAGLHGLLGNASIQFLEEEALIADPLAYVLYAFLVRLRQGDFDRAFELIRAKHTASGCYEDFWNDEVEVFGLSDLMSIPGFRRLQAEADSCHAARMARYSRRL